MRFVATALPGVFVIEPEPIHDERGSFARTFCKRELAAQGLETEFAQHSVSVNTRRGTLRGLHFQADPWAESKIVSCGRGRIFDVVVDLRPSGSGGPRWISVELDGDDARSLYIPKGCAHGFQTLVDDTRVAYQISELYRPAAARGLRWNDPALAIAWPLAEPIISQRDAAWPLLG